MVGELGHRGLIVFLPALIISKIAVCRMRVQCVSRRCYSSMVYCRRPPITKTQVMDQPRQAKYTLFSLIRHFQEKLRPTRADRITTFRNLLVALPLLLS